MSQIYQRSVQRRSVDSDSDDDADDKTKDVIQKVPKVIYLLAASFSTLMILVR